MTHQLSIPEFIEPAHPDLQPVLAIHRGHDGFVSFHRHDKGEFQDLFSIKARDLEGVFPQLVPKLETDAYFSVHGFWRDGHGISRNAPKGTTLGRAHRSSSDLRWLTCCFADLDCHSLGVSLGTAIGAVIDAQDKKEIPPASMLTRSGRGLWAFWFLASDDGSSLVRSDPQKVQLWAAIQNAIGERLAAIGADAQARDVSRVTRIAGSVNSKTAAGSRVAYWIQANSLGQRYTYRLGDLASCFNVSLPKPNRLISAKNAELQARGRKGSAGRWRHDLARFNALSELRKTWPVGVRNNAVFVLATILKSLKRADGRPEFPPGVVLEEIRNLWKRMEQPSGNRFDWQAAVATVNVSESRPVSRPVKHQTIADLLRVTPEEAELCGWPAASAFGKKPEVAQLSRTATCLKRREAIRDIVGELGHCPPYRDLAKRVEERCGIPAPMSVVRADCKDMGIKNPRSRRKPRKRAQSKQRKLFSE